MQFKSLPTVTVIKKEEKEATLKAFIADHFARFDGSVGNRMQAADRVFLLIARSNESPVVRALASALAEAATTDISLKALIMLPGSQANSGWPAEMAQATDCRALGDLRLLDAHEQLWLDGETAWIGDSMRREPAKRDAYECYARGCEITAQFVEAAFNRLWEKGSATVIEVEDAASAVTDTIDAHLTQVAPTDNPAPTAATRH